jgi:endonuclease YncB( thermonuclease family)
LDKVRELTESGGAEQSALERIAVWMIERGYATGHGDTIEDLLAELEAQARRRM